MRSAKDIERSIKNLDWDVDIDARTDREILDELVDAHRQSARTQPAVATLSWKAVAGSWTVRLAAAAVIIGIAGLFSLRYAPREPRVIPPPGAMMSAAEMLSVGQLKAAYYRGGLGELEAQCEKAAERMDVAPTKMSLEDLIVELKGT
jgi:hypothetical protein